jgi:hypothetical protein
LEHDVGEDCALGVVVAIPPAHELVEVRVVLIMDGLLLKGSPAWLGGSGSRGRRRRWRRIFIFVIVIVVIGFVRFVGGGRRMFICSSSRANGDGFKGLLKTVVDDSSITGTLGLGAAAGASSHGAALGCILMLVGEREASCLWIFG